MVLSRRSSGRGRCDEDGVSEDAKESVEDDKDGGELRFGRAGLPEFDRLTDESSFEDSDSEEVVPGGKTSAVDNSTNDCDTRSSAHSLSRYNVATGPRFASIGARGSGRGP